jgi:hypothetical protein
VSEAVFLNEELAFPESNKISIDRFELIITKNASETSSRGIF